MRILFMVSCMTHTSKARVRVRVLTYAVGTRKTNHGAYACTAQESICTVRVRITSFVHTWSRRHVVVSAAGPRVGKTLAEVVALPPSIYPQAETFKARSICPFLLCIFFFIHRQLTIVVVKTAINVRPNARMNVLTS